MSSGDEELKENRATEQDATAFSFEPVANTSHMESRAADLLLSAPYENSASGTPDAVRASRACAQRYQTSTGGGAQPRTRRHPALCVNEARAADQAPPLIALRANR